eukprot:1252092-Pleurochrysis_carterae.AAC.1
MPAQRDLQDMLCRERPGGGTDSSEGTAREDELARVHLAACTGLIDKAMTLGRLSQARRRSSAGGPRCSAGGV